MGIQIDYDRADARLREAVAWAQSDRPVPDEWVRATEAIGESPSKTYVVSLGTGLLARAVDSRVDSLALKASSGPKAFSARGLAHKILVPLAVEAGYDLGAKGREPLNNQPFFRYDRVDEFERIHSSAEHHHELLVSLLSRANGLTEDGALAALAAFLRVRMKVAGDFERIDLRGTAVGLRQTLAMTDLFLREDVEGGKRAQACVAAVLDLVYDRVRMVRINDPSRRLPGDVQAFHASRGRPILAAEVRAKIVTETEVVRFARELPASGIEHGLVVALAPEQPRLPVVELRQQVFDEVGVLLCIADDVGELLLDALAWSVRPLTDLLADFPDLFARRLEEIEVRDATRETWAELCRQGRSRPEVEGS